MPRIKWRLGKNYISQDQLVPRLNINNYLKQMEKDFDPYRQQWDNDDENYISQYNLNMITDINFGIGAVVGMRMIYDELLNRDQLEEH